MDQQHFTDGIGRITVIGGIVRLDLVTYSATETDASGNARPVLTQRVLMGVDAFLRSSEKILETVQAITKAQQQRAVPAPQQQAAPQQPAPQPQQPTAQHNPSPLPRQEQIAPPQPLAPPPPRPKPFP
jgi:hypothetical protein